MITNLTHNSKHVFDKSLSVYNYVHSVSVCTDINDICNSGFLLYDSRLSTSDIYTCTCLSYDETVCFDVSNISPCIFRHSYCSQCEIMLSGHTGHTHMFISGNNSYPLCCSCEVGNAISIYNDTTNSLLCDDITYSKVNSIIHSSIGSVSNNDRCGDSIASYIAYQDGYLIHSHYNYDTDLFASSNDESSLSDDIFSLSSISSDSQVFSPVYDDCKLVYSDDVQFQRVYNNSNDDPVQADDTCGFSNNNNNVSNVHINSCKNNDSDVSFYHDINYGFIPQCYVTPNNKSHMSVPGNGIDWLISVRNIIAGTKVANYRQARIQLPSRFNFDLWYKCLDGYIDIQVVDYLHFGFPLSVNDGFVAHAVDYNHSSATKFHKHVQEYLNTEMAEKALLGPFNKHPLENFNISPIMSRPKGNDKRRIIVDLSWKGEHSLNANVTPHYDGIPYILRYPSLDLIQKRVVHLGHTACIFKIDISRAFRNLPVDPIDVNCLGLYWDNSYFIDLSIPFGYIHGSACCQRVTDAIRYICAKNNIFLFNYCDDLIGVELPHKVEHAFRFTKNLVSDLGFPINLDKLVVPSSVATCLGIQISVIDMTFSVPVDKLYYIKQLCIQWLNKSVVSKNKLQSLLGKLLYISKCVRYARVFMGRMLKTYRKHHKSAVVVLDDEFYKDLAWFNKFLFTFNGCVFINKEVKRTLFVDASFMGIGGIFDNNVYAYHIPECCVNYSIVHLELINVLVALRCWSHLFNNSVVKIYCDNATVVAALNNFRIKDDLILLMVRNIWLILASCNIELVVEHIPGVRNVHADILSRWGGRDRFRVEDVMFLSNECQWFHIHDSFFDLDVHI